MNYGRLGRGTTGDVRLPLGSSRVDQRYYASAYGRFNAVDRLASSADPKTPQSWNRYAYVQGDPVNGNDPTGQMEYVSCGFGDDPMDW